MPEVDLRRAATPRAAPRRTPHAVIHADARHAGHALAGGPRPRGRHPGAPHHVDRGQHDAGRRRSPDLRPGAHRPVALADPARLAGDAVRGGVGARDHRQGGVWLRARVARARLHHRRRPRLGPRVRLAGGRACDGWDRSRARRLQAAVGPRPRRGRRRPLEDAGLVPGRGGRGRRVRLHLGRPPHPRHARTARAVVHRRRRVDRRPVDRGRAAGHLEEQRRSALAASPPSRDLGP